MFFFFCRISTRSCSCIRDDFASDDDLLVPFEKRVRRVFPLPFSEHTCYPHNLLIRLSGHNYTPSLRFTIPASLDFA